MGSEKSVVGDTQNDTTTCDEVMVVLYSTEVRVPSYPYVPVPVDSS